MEIIRLTDALTFFATQFGGDHPLVQKVLAGKSPRERAVELINGTQVRDVANALLGTGGSRYPDATGTLRLSFGTVKGYEEDGKPVPPFTTFAGFYQRAKDMKNRPPFDLPESWEVARKHLNLQTPFNFVSTADIIGGNSGSPVVNRAGEFVGIIFDGNIQSLPLDYAFDDKQARAVSVDSAAILEGLDKVYHAKELVQELQEGKRSEK
jgi:hypothetical protein